MKMKVRLNGKSTKSMVLALVLIVVIIAGVYYLGWSKRKAEIKVKSETLENAVTLFDSGKKDESISVLEAMVQRNPADKDALNLLASEYYQAGKYDQFISFINEHKLESSLICNMAANIYQTKGQGEVAVEFYNKAISASPKNPGYYINLSAYYQGIGDYASALKTLELGLSKITNSTSLNNSAASVALKSGDKASARKYANAALAIDPNNSQAKAILAKL